MGAKKSIAVSEEKIALLECFLRNAQAPEEVLSAFTELRNNNDIAKAVLDKNSRLRQLYLKAIRKCPSSERVIPEKKADKPQPTAKELRKFARKEAEKAWLHKQRSRHMVNLAKLAEKEDQMSNSKNDCSVNAINTDKSDNNAQGAGECNTRQNSGSKNWEVVLAAAEKAYDEATTYGTSLAAVACEELLRRYKNGSFDPFEVDVPEDFPNILEEAFAIGKILDGENGDFRRVRDAVWKDSGAAAGRGFRLFPCATLFSSQPGLTTSKEHRLLVNESFPRTGFRQSFEESTRWDLSFQITELKVKREVLYNPETGERVAAPQTLGPAGFQLTWRAFTTICILAVEYIMPFNRISALISTPEKSFSRSHIWDILCYVGECLVDPWIEMATDLAVNGYCWFGDDAATRTRRMKPEEPPEPGARSRHFEEEALSKLHNIFRRDATKANGTVKRGSYTTVFSGQTKTRDEKSWIVLFFTHFGSFGDMVEDMLAIRDKDRRARYAVRKDEAQKKGEPVPDDPSGKLPKDQTTIDITCDASAANKPKKDYGFNLRYFGCAMHARRKFVEIPEEDRSEEVNNILSYFAFLYANEEFISETGRTPSRVARMRCRWGTWAWENINIEAQNILAKPDASQMELRAAEYVVKNFDTLQRALDSISSALDNGISERFIRPIRLAENTTHGLETERGRLVKDVIRSIIATCRAIGVSFEEYLPWVLMRSERAQGLPTVHPRDLTPHAFLQSRQSERQPRG